ncbi:MAG: Hsp20/alpha crystallin family protein [Planctomycetota bacterium]
MALPTTIQRHRGNDVFVDMQREFDTMLGRFFGQTPQTTNGRRSAPYAVDIHEDENALYFEAELPGFSKEHIDVTVDNSVLTVTAERSPATSDDDKRETLLNERRYTYFSRSFSLPQTVATDNVEAKLDAGVLYLKLAKKEETKPRKITVS